MAEEQIKSIFTFIKKLLIWPAKRFGRMGTKGKVITIFVLFLIAIWRINVYRNSGLEVNIEKAQFGKLTENISASGEITAENSASLAFRTAGEITEINFKVGDQVKKGDVIAKLDTTLLYSAYQQADAALRAAQASLDSTYDSLQGHDDDETYAQISTRTTAETTKDSYYWAYVSATKNLEGAYIKAPFDGILTYVPDNIVPGTYISLPQSAAFQVIGPESTQFEAEINEIDIHKLTSGAVAQIEIDAFPDEVLEGIVSGYNFTSTTTSTGGTAYKATITLPENNDLKYKPGMNGDAKIIISETEGLLLVPITAVVEETNKEYVWISEKGRAKKIEVTTGRSSIEIIEIKSGIEEGTEVISRPPNKIEEGAKLKIIN